MVLDEEAAKLVALKFLQSATSSFGDRASRRFDKVKFGLGARLKNDPTACPQSDSGLILRLGFSDDTVKGARKTNLAIHEFKEKYPEYGVILQAMIDKHRLIRIGYLEFGGKVSDEVYISLIQDIAGVELSKARSIYDSVVQIGEAIGKYRGTVSQTLLQE